MSTILKVCTRCKTLRDTTAFHKGRNDCKECIKEDNASYRHSVRGLIRSIYKNQKASSIRRGHTAPNYTFDELYQWITSQSNFTQLYQDWCDADYLKDLAPSCDRLDDYTPYTISNLRLVTWKENNDKYREDVKQRKNTKALRPINQYEKDGAFVATFPAIVDAKRAMNTTSGNISEVLAGRRKTAHGYIWQYKN